MQVVDPFGAGSGSSGGIVGALSPHVPERWNAKKAFQLESLLMAEQFWQEVHRAGGTDSGYARRGRLQTVASDRYLELAHNRAEEAKVLWQGQAVWEVIPQNEAEWAPQSPTGWLIHDTLSAHIHPRRACEALLAALSANGAEVVAQAKDRGKVIWATGLAGLHVLGEGNREKVGDGIKGQAALLRHNAGDVPQIYAAGVHIIPHLDGTVAIGSTSEKQFDCPIGTDAQLEALIETARRAVPALQDAPVIARWAAVRPRSRNRAPLLGAWPGRESHYIANGGYKIGFGMAPKIAEVMADLMLEGRNEIPSGFEAATVL